MIKELKPSKNSIYQQGYVNPQDCRKLFESQVGLPIIYRSSWELKFIKWCERSDKVKRWGSEVIEIPYISPLDNKRHRYYPDYVLELEDESRVVVEIKPYSQTQPPKKRSSVYTQEVWLKNSAKWRATKEFCQQNNIKFWILTENTINKL